jgi:hypothetical protein
MIEARLALATPAQRFRLALVLEHPVVPDPTFTLRPRDGLFMTLHGRLMGYEAVAVPRA